MGHANPESTSYGSICLDSDQFLHLSKPKYITFVVQIAIARDTADC
jgi:hypothetical protein